MRQTTQCCGNSKCQTTQTPLWRKGWFSHDGKTVMLCNACGLHYKKGHYCMYCNQIYRESDADDSNNPWIGCDRCSRWVHQKCEEANGHNWTQHGSYQCPDCRCAPPTSEATINVSIPTTTAITTNPGTQMRKKSTQGQKKRRRTPSGSLLGDSSPGTPISPITPGSNFLLFTQPEKTEPTTLFEANTNAMPCWNQLHATIQSLPAVGSSPSTPTNSKKRKLDTTTTTTTKQKKSRTTTTITTTTTHRMNSAGIDALMGVVEEKEDIVPHLDLHITTTVRKGKQTSRKMNADARSAAIASSNDTPTTPTSFYAPPLFATMTTTTTTVASAENAAKNNASLSEEQFYQYQQLIMKQQEKATPAQGAVPVEPIAKQTPVTILQNTFGSVDTLGNFYGSFNEQAKKSEASPYGLLIDEEYDELSETRRPQKRARKVSPPKKVTTTTTTLTMTVSSASVKSKRVRDQMAKNGGTRVNYSGTSSDTEESEYEPDQIVPSATSWDEAAKVLNVDLDDAYTLLTTRFPSAPVLKKMESLLALCEVIRQIGRAHV